MLTTIKILKWRRKKNIKLHCWIEWLWLFQCQIKYKKKKTLLPRKLSHKIKWLLMIESKHLSNISTNKPKYDSQQRRGKTNVWMSDSISLFQTSLLYQATTYLLALAKATNEQLGHVLHPELIWTQSPEKGAVVCISLSICCQHKARFEVKHQSQRSLWVQHLLFWGCQAAYPLASFIKSPWKNRPQKCSPLSECPDVIVF